MRSVPVAVHYDYGLTFNKCMETLQLDFKYISNIVERTGVLLVLYGGSGLNDNDFKEAI